MVNLSIFSPSNSLKFHSCQIFPLPKCCSMQISWTTKVVHNKDWPENFQKSLIERTGKAAFQALDLSLKSSRPLLSVLKTDKEGFYPLEVHIGDF